MIAAASEKSCEGTCFDASAEVGVCALSVEVHLRRQQGAHFLRLTIFLKEASNSPTQPHQDGVVSGLAPIATSIPTSQKGLSHSRYLTFAVLQIGPRPLQPLQNNVIAGH